MVLAMTTRIPVLQNNKRSGDLVRTADRYNPAMPPRITIPRITLLHCAAAYMSCGVAGRSHISGIVKHHLDFFARLPSEHRHG